MSVIVNVSHQGQCALTHFHFVEAGNSVGGRRFNQSNEELRANRIPLHFSSSRSGRTAATPRRFSFRSEGEPRGEPEGSGCGENIAIGNTMPGLVDPTPVITGDDRVFII